MQGPWRNVVAWVVTAGTCAALILLLRLSTYVKAIDEALARKLLHTGCGLVFLLCWPLYDPRAAWSACLCASVPALATAHFLLVGAGLQRDPDLVRSFTRRGDPSELLLGPAAYGCVHVAATLAYWAGAPGGVLVIAILCAGDGLADIVGRRLGRRTKWPHNRDKSPAGSLAFFLAGTAAALAALLFASDQGLVAQKLGVLEAAQLAATCAAVGAGVESLALPMDNLTVPAAVALTAHVLRRP